MANGVSKDDMISGYVTSTVKAIEVLFNNDLYGQVLIIIYSSIDTAGLLDAPPNQNTATGTTFKNWVSKFMLNKPGVNFSDVDLWGARCAVLHTFTSESDLSKRGVAKEIHYYVGDKGDKSVQDLLAAAQNVKGGSLLPVHYADLCQSFLSGLKEFVYELDKNCVADKAYLDRLDNVLQNYAIDRGS